MSGEGTYVCRLDERTLRKARDELNEDPKQRASQIQALRDWIKTQPHLRSRTDDEFLLRFLRGAKFSLLRAQQLIDNFWTIRSVPDKGVPEWFMHMDPLDPEMQETIDTGVQVPLPGHDDQGRKVLLIRTGCYDPQKIKFANIMKSSFLTSDVLIRDEANQVHGYTIILDFTGFSTAHAFNWDRDTIRKSSKCWQDMYPNRNKGVNYYNTPTIFNALFEVFKYFMKEKTKKRLIFHKDSLESLYKEVPRRMLPKEYGGEAGPLQDIIKSWKEELIKNKSEFDLNAQYGVDEEKRPKPEGAANGNSWGMLGSFRKLEV